MDCQTINEQFSDGKIFSVKFTKMDGTNRDMVCRLASTVNIGKKGGELPYNADEKNIIIVLDMALLSTLKQQNKFTSTDILANRCYRAIPCDNIISLNGVPNV